MHFDLHTASARETAGLGEKLGAVCSGRLAFLLTGEYGTGKTTFIQGLARGLGIPGPVRSPSYNIMKVYSDGRLPLIHADLYRTHSGADIDELGILDLLPDPGVLAVEWPGRLVDIGTGLPEIYIRFQYLTSATEDSECLDSAPRRLEITLGADCPAAVREVVVAAVAG